MRSFFISAVIAFLSVANFVSPSFAQDSGMSAEKRDVLIGQLENVLQELRNERAAANETPPASNVVEGSLSANDLMTLGEVYAAPVADQAQLAYAAPVLQSTSVQQAPVVTSIGPLLDITLPPINFIEPAPAPTIIVQQAPAALSFQPVFMNFVAPMPFPGPQPRRRKCCLFGR